MTAGRPSGHRQDADRARSSGRSQRSVLHHLRLRLRRDVCRRRRLARARHVRAGQEECACIIFIRRNRTRSAVIAAPASAAAMTSASDAQPVAGRNGWLRANEGIILIAATNGRCARSGAAAAPRPFRTSGGGANRDVVGRENILRVHVKKVAARPRRPISRPPRAVRPASLARLGQSGNEASVDGGTVDNSAWSRRPSSRTHKDKV